MFSFYTYSRRIETRDVLDRSFEKKGIERVTIICTRTYRQNRTRALTILLFFISCFDGGAGNCCKGSLKESDLLYNSFVLAKSLPIRKQFSVQIIRINHELRSVESLKRGIEHEELLVVRIQETATDEEEETVASSVLDGAVSQQRLIEQSNMSPYRP